MSLLCVKFFSGFLLRIKFIVFTMSQKAQHYPSGLYLLLLSPLFYPNCPLFQQARSTVPQFFSRLVLSFPKGIYSLSRESLSCPSYINFHDSTYTSTFHVLLPCFMFYFLVLITNLFCLLSISLTKI